MGIINVYESGSELNQSYIDKTIERMFVVIKEELPEEAQTEGIIESVLSDFQKALKAKRLKL